MNPRRLALTLMTAALIAGCGGSDEEAPATSSQASTTPTPEATPAATNTPQATEEPSSGGAGKATPLGTKLKMGETATIAYEDSSNNRKSLIELTPLKVKKGSLEDFKNIELDAEQKKATPYYATFRVKNVGKNDLGEAEPAGYVNGVDDRGQDQNEVIFFGDFAACDHVTPKAFKPGDEYETCLTYMVPGGGSIEGFHWIAFDEKTGKSDLIWE